MRQTKLTLTKPDAYPFERPAAAAELSPAVVAPHRAMATTSSDTRPLPHATDAKEPASASARILAANPIYWGSYSGPAEFSFP